MLWEAIYMKHNCLPTEKPLHLYWISTFIYLYVAVGSYLEYLRDLETKIDQDWDSISSSLEEMRKSLFSKNGCLINLTSDWKNLEKSSQYITKFLDSLPSSPSLGSDPWLSRLPSVNEAIVVPTQVRAISLEGIPNWQFGIVSFQYHFICLR